MIAAIEEEIGLGHIPTDYADRPSIHRRPPLDAGRALRTSANIEAANDNRARMQDAGYWRSHRCGGFPPGGLFSDRAGSRDWWQTTMMESYGGIGSSNMAPNETQQWGFVPCSHCHRAASWPRSIDRKYVIAWILRCREEFMGEEMQRTCPECNGDGQVAVSGVSSRPVGGGPVTHVVDQHAECLECSGTGGVGTLGASVWPIHLREYQSNNWVSIDEESHDANLPGHSDYVIVEFHLTNCPVCATQCVAPRATHMPAWPLEGMVTINTDPFSSPNDVMTVAGFRQHMGQLIVNAVDVDPETGHARLWHWPSLSNQPDTTLWSRDPQGAHSHSSTSLEAVSEEIQNVIREYLSCGSMMLRERLIDLCACSHCKGKGHTWFAEWQIDYADADVHYDDDDYSDDSHQRHNIDADRPWEGDDWKRRLRPPDGTKAQKQKCAQCDGNGIYNDAVTIAINALPAPMDTRSIATVKQFEVHLDNMVPMERV